MKKPINLREFKVINGHYFYGHQEELRNPLKCDEWVNYFKSWKIIKTPNDTEIAEEENYESRSS